MANSGAALAGRCIMGDGTQTAWPRIPTAALTASESSGGKSQTPGIYPSFAPGLLTAKSPWLYWACSKFNLCFSSFISFLFFCWFEVLTLQRLSINGPWSQLLFEMRSQRWSETVEALFSIRLFKDDLRWSQWVTVPAADAFTFL